MMPTLADDAKLHCRIVLQTTATVAGDGRERTKHAFEMIVAPDDDGGAEN